MMKACYETALSPTNTLFLFVFFCIFNG